MITNETAIHFGISSKNARERKRNQPEIDISDWESHLKNVLGHRSPDKEETQTHTNTENDTNETFVSELDNHITEHEVRNQSNFFLKPVD